MKFITGNGMAEIYGRALLLVALLLAAGSIAAVCIMKKETKSISLEEQEPVIYFFHNNPCESCDETNKLREILKKEFSQDEVTVKYTIQSYYSYQTEGRSIMNLMMERFGLSNEEITYPFAVVGEEYLNGYTEIEERIRSCMEKAAGIVREDGKGMAEGSASLDSFGFGGTIGDASTINILYFQTESCHNCEEAWKYIETIPDEVMIDGKNHKIITEALSVMDEGNAQYLMELFKKYQVPELKQQVPILFIGNEYLSGEALIKEKLEALIQTGEGLGQVYQAEAVSGLQESVQFAKPSFLVGVIGVGILNGWNPCTMSITLLFLSLLASGKKHFLKYGISFLAGKFLAYLGVGLTIAGTISAVSLKSFNVAGKMLNIILICFCFVLAISNTVDYCHVKKGEYGKVKVQLPAFLRKWNDEVIKKAVKPGIGRLMILAIFGSSIVIAIGEFFCTGQIYLASILGWVQEATQKGVPLFVFLIYVTALCVPSLCVVILVNRGKSVLALSDFSLRRMPVVKMCNAVLFTLLGLYSLFQLL